MTGEYSRRGLGWACAAAVVATAGDLGLLWVGNAARPELGLAEPPGFALALGGVAGALAIPVYALGYRALAAVLRASAPLTARVTALCGLAVGFVGGAIHALTAFVIQSGLASGSAAAPPLDAVAAQGGLLVGAWLVAALALVAASGALVAASLRREPALPRALAWLNPLALTLLFGALGAGSEWGRSFLLPAAPNLAHVAFFGLALGVLPLPRAAG